MARKQPQTLFEGYSRFRGVHHRQNAVAAGGQPQQPAVPAERTMPTTGPVAPAAGDRYVIRLTAMQVFVGSLLALMALAVAGYAGYTIGMTRLRRLDQNRPTLGEIMAQPPQPQVLSNSGAATLAEREPFAHVNQPVATVAAEPVAPAPSGPDGLVDPALSGDFRVRIMSLPVEHRDTQESLTQSRAFLAEQGIATDVEQRGRNYYLYSRQTFPSETHEKAIELRDRIRGLGAEYARRFNRSNEFSSAYIAKKS